MLLSFSERFTNKRKKSKRSVVLSYSAYSSVLLQNKIYFEQTASIPHQFSKQSPSFSRSVKGAPPLTSNMERAASCCGNVFPWHTGRSWKDKKRKKRVRGSKRLQTEMKVPLPKHTVNATMDWFRSKYIRVTQIELRICSRSRKLLSIESDWTWAVFFLKSNWKTIQSLDV